MASSAQQMRQGEPGAFSEPCAQMRWSYMMDRTEGRAGQCPPLKLSSGVPHADREGKVCRAQHRLQYICGACEMHR